jgi:hypothetical protein
MFRVCGLGSRVYDLGFRAPWVRVCVRVYILGILGLWFKIQKFSLATELELKF